MRARTLILCHANRYRSPLGAAMLSQHPHLDVRSAGFLRSGLKAGKPVRDTAKELGFNLDDHRSTEVNTMLVNWADYILLMNPTQLHKLNHAYGIKPNRKHLLLGAFLTPGVSSIPDLGFINPALPQWEVTVRMIERATRKFAECLQHPNPDLTLFATLSNSARG